jgi:N-acetylglucosaminyldiphosphoundecaprenol N-acetyl-beta-D-mannosaminyltransferase
MMETVRICGLNVGRIGMEAAVEMIAERAKRRQGGWLALLNLEMVARAKKQSEYFELLKQADIVLADGMPIVWASNKIGLPIPERVAGVDLTQRLLADTFDFRISIVGGENPFLALTKIGIANLKRFQIETGIVQTDAKGVAKIEGMLKEHDPHLVFLALGVGKQDVIASKLKAVLPGAVIMGVGGSFEMIAGIKRRAPRAMQKIGMEWLFRLMIEPKRLWKRYLVNYPPGAIWLMRCVREEKRRLRQEAAAR